MDIRPHESIIRLVHKFEVNDETIRPFRLYSANEKSFYRWRYYSDDKRAHMGALIECRWAKVGTVIEVIDVSIGKMIGSYRRGVNDIQFMRGT